MRNYIELINMEYSKPKVIIEMAEYLELKHGTPEDREYAKKMSETNESGISMLLKRNLSQENKLLKEQNNALALKNNELESTILSLKKQLER